MEVQVHRCRFLNHELSKISALSFNHNSPGTQKMPHPDLRLAVGRSNGTIEIWNPGANWLLERTMHGSKGTSIEDLVYIKTDDAGSRLFSLSASDLFTEWDLSTGLPLAHHQADAGVVWSIKVSPNQSFLAAACETGTVVVFDISGGPGNAVFHKRLQTAGVSLASLCWLGNSRLAAGGVDGTIRVWDVAKNFIVSTMKVDKTKGPEPTIVWSLLSLRDGDQLVSGDSNGYLKIWDCAKLTLQQSFKAHPVDILCLASDAKGESLFSAGVDQKIVLCKITDPKHKRFTIFSNRVGHSNDIRCMASYEAKGQSLLVSGGLDKVLVVDSVTDFDRVPSKRLPPFKYPPPVHASGRHLAEWFENSVRLWELGTAEKNQRLLLQLNSGQEEYISTVSLSEESAVLAVGTVASLVLYNLEGFPQITAVNERTVDLDGVSHVEFISPTKLIFAAVDGRIGILDVGTLESKILPSAQQKPSKIPYGHAVSHMCTFQGTFAVARYTTMIELFNESGSLGCLPKINTPITAMGFRNANSLVVATADKEILEFDQEHSLTSWSRQHMGQASILPKGTPNAHGLFPDSDDKNKCWLWGATWMACLDFGAQTPRRTHKRKLPNGASEAGNDKAASPLQLVTKFKPILYAGSVGPGELVVCEMPPEDTSAKSFWSNRKVQI